MARSAAWAVNDLAGGPAVNQLDLHPPVSAIAADMQWLHNFMLVVCLVIFFAVFGVMFYSIFKHRKSKGARAANFHESTTVEIAWTVVPFIIVILMALPATRVVVAMKDTSAADLTDQGHRLPVEVGLRLPQRRGRGHRLPLHARPDPARAVRRRQAVGRRLPAEGRQPAGRAGRTSKIRIITTANDVIHAWGVPSLGVKQDAIPGFVRDAWFRAEQDGDFYGQCSELCGKEHAYMPIHVKVRVAAGLQRLGRRRKKEMAAKADDPNKVWDLAGLLARGEKVYAANCQVCHQPNGKGGGAIKPLDALAGRARRRQDQADPRSC